MSDTNRAVQTQKIARGLKFRKWRDCSTYVAKKKCPDQLRGNCAADLRVFAYATSRFSHDAAQYILYEMAYFSKHCLLYKLVSKMQEMIYTSH